MSVQLPLETPAPLREARPIPRSAKGDWTWELVSTYPAQGSWCEKDYLRLAEDVRAEFNRGVLEFRPVPTWFHAWIVDYLHDALKARVRREKLGLTATSPVRVRTSPDQLREPDVVFLQPHRLPDPSAPSLGADLVMEVVSEGSEARERDLVTKRQEYALAGIPEYWIVDPLTQTITVLTLPPGATEYTEHGVFGPGDTASSVLLAGLEITVSDCFAAG